VDLSAAQPLFAVQPDLVAVWLFGSRARGDHRSDSDVDLGLLLTRTPASIADMGFQLQDELTLALGLTVQVTVLNDAPADLVKRVFAEGSLVYERDRAARIAFEIRKRNEYWDLAPMWALIRRLPPGVMP
jgi:uncharacterized protein